jgi:hypothetical protein
MTTIIAADYMYLIFLGDPDTLNRLIIRLNKNSDNIENEKINNSYRYNKTNKMKEIYLKYNICDPCVGILEEEMIRSILDNDAKKAILKKNIKPTDHDIDLHKKYVVLDEGVETAQCLTYADIISPNELMGYTEYSDGCKLMMMMVMNQYDSHYKLSFPILQLEEEENPDKLISKWIKDHDLGDLVKELTIRPVNIVGNDHDILVFSALIDG